jgi:hypothetical protein
LPFLSVPKHAYPEALKAYCNKINYFMRTIIDVKFSGALHACDMHVKSAPCGFHM